MAFTYTTAEVAESLRVARNTLGRMRAADILRPGVHFVAVGESLRRPTLRWDLEAVEDTMSRRSKQIRRPKSDGDRFAAATR